MYCGICGTSVNEGAMYCGNCGNPMQSNNQEEYYEKGCLSQAWTDIKKEGGLFKRILILSLIGLVPILNFCCFGYMFNMARNIVRDSKDVYPKEYISEETFKNGFFSWAISYIFTFPVMFVFEILFLIVFVGTFIPAIQGDIVPLIASSVLFALVVIALLVFFTPFIDLASFRAISIKFSAAFNFSKVAKAYKAKFSQLLCLEFVPGLIACLVLLLIVGILTLLSFLAIIVKINIALTGVLLLLFVLAYAFVIMVVCLFFGTISKRALGIYISRYAPDWKSESLIAQPAYTLVPVYVQQPYQYYANQSGQYVQYVQPVQYTQTGTPPQPVQHIQSNVVVQPTQNVQPNAAGQSTQNEQSAVFVQPEQPQPPFQ